MCAYGNVLKLSHIITLSAGYGVQNFMSIQLLNIITNVRNPLSLFLYQSQILNLFLIQMIYYHKNHKNKFINKNRKNNIY